MDDLITLLLFSIAVACFLAFYFMPAEVKQSSSSSSSAAATSSRGGVQLDEVKEDTERHQLVVRQNNNRDRQRRNHNNNDDEDDQHERMFDREPAARFMAMRDDAVRGGAGGGRGGGRLAGLRRENRAQMMRENNRQRLEQELRERRGENNPENEDGDDEGEERDGRGDELDVEVDPFQNLREERERQKQNEIQQWKKHFTVESSGSFKTAAAAAAANKADKSSSSISASSARSSQKPLSALEERVISEIEKAASPVIVLEQLAVSCGGVAVPALVDAIEAAKMKTGRVIGVFDDRGKLLRLSESMLNDVRDFIEQRGRVSHSQVKEYCERNLR